MLNEITGFASYKLCCDVTIILLLAKAICDVICTIDAISCIDMKVQITFRLFYNNVIVIWNYWI